MDESFSVPNILSTISDPKYCERDLLRNLYDLQLLDEDMYIESFLQFILDCAEIPLHITIDISFSEAIFRCTMNDTLSEQFLVYKEPDRAHLITGFLKAFLSAKEPARWTEKFTENVADLIEAMLEVDNNPRVTCCAMFFLVGILFECTCIRSNCRMNEESAILVKFCRNLLGMYDYDLLTDDNYLDIGLQLNYLFLFSAELFLDGDVENVKHLTALLLIDNNQLKGELLKTFETVLEAPTTPSLVKQGIIDELVILRDVLISFCHFCPSTVAITALKLLKSYPNELLSDVEAKDKVYLLMTNANKKVRELAKGYFLESFKEYLSREGEDDQEPTHDILLKVLDKFVGKYEDAVNHLPEIMHLLLVDYFPSLMELFLYIVQTKSKVASRISSILIKMMIEKLEESPEAFERLSDFVKICRGVVQSLSLLADKFLYLELIRNIAQIPNSILKEISSEDVIGIKENILSRLMDPGVIYEDRKWIAGLLIKLIAVKGVPEDRIEMLRYQMDNWEGLAVCLEAILSSSDSKSLEFEGLELMELNSIAADELEGEREDKLHIVHVKQMCVTILVEKGELSGCEVVSEAVSLLRFIEKEFLGKNDATKDLVDFQIILRVAVNLILVSVPFYKFASPDELDYLKNLVSPFEFWLRKLPESLDSHKLILDLMEFSPNVSRFEVSKLWMILLKNTNHRKLIPEFMKTCFQNRFVDPQTTKTFFIETTAKTIQSLNCAEPPISWTTAAAQAFQKYVLTEMSSNSDLIAHEAQIISEILIHVFAQFEDFLMENGPPAKKTDHRLKALDVFLDNANLLKKFNLTSGDRTNITKSILKVMKKPATTTEAEFKCLQKIVATWR